MKKLSETLGIEYEKQVEEVEPPKKTNVPVIQKEPSEQLPAVPESKALSGDQKEDYVLARETFRDLITKGNDALDGLATLAQQSESPRAYEVMATLIQTIAATTKDLFDLQKKTKDLMTGTADAKKLDETNITVDKAVFVGTTHDLLKDMKKKVNN